MYMYIVYKLEQWPNSSNSPLLLPIHEWLTPFRGIHNYVSGIWRSGVAGKKALTTCRFSLPSPFPFKEKILYYICSFKFSILDSSIYFLLKLRNVQETHSGKNTRFKVIHQLLLL